jgi:hypothetical protein
VTDLSSCSFLFRCPSVGGRVEPDEASGVAPVVGDVTVLERHQTLVVERIFALASDCADAAVLALEPHAAAHRNNYQGLTAAL